MLSDILTNIMRQGHVIEFKYTCVFSLLLHIHYYRMGQDDFVE